MKKSLRFIFSVLLTSSFFALNGQNTSSGNCFMIDYVSWNAGTSKPPVFINCGNSNAFNTGYELTMEVWIRIYDASWNQKIMGKASNTFDNGYVQAIEAGQNYSEIWNPNKNQIKAGSIPQDSAWVHLATVFTGGDKMIGYVNGIKVQEVSVPSNQIASNSSPFIIGNAPWDLVSLQTFGYIDEIRIWNTARNESDIKDFMFKSLKGNENGLVAYYNFNQSSGATLNDITSNANHGTISGAPYYSFVPSYAVIADDSMYNMQDVQAVWYGKDPTQFNYAVTNNGLSLITNISDKAFDYAIFGHNGDSGLTVQGIPAEASADFKRLKRVWYFSTGGNVSAKWYFNLLSAAGGGTMLNATANPLYYTLLMSDSANGHFVPVVAAGSIVSGVVKFDQFSPILNKYYTIGVGSTQIASGVGIVDHFRSSFSIFPNPCSNEVQIHGTKDASLFVMDVNGKIVFQQKCSENKINLDLSSYSKGLYFVQLINNSGAETKSLIIH